MTRRKSNFVQTVFSQVPATYELANHVLTLGLDIVWRKRTARTASKAKTDFWVDMCTGTGETAAYLSRAAPNGTKIFAVDFSLPMLETAKTKPEAKHISFVASDINALPFSDESFDLVTMSFATRNLNLSKDILIKSFSEYYRLLRPGGRFVNLETSQPRATFVRKCFHLYVKLFVKSIGSRISGSKTAYTYLANTIPRFYPPEELSEIMKQAGFEEVTFQRHSLGIVAIHLALKS